MSFFKKIFNLINTKKQSKHKELDIVAKEKEDSASIKEETTLLFIERAIKRASNLKKVGNTNKKPNLSIVELSFTKEDVYKEFDAILKENPYKMDEECLKRIEGIEILDMHMRANSETINMYYREKYNNNIYEHELTASFETAEKWARYFYGDILQNYDPQENDPEVNELIKKAGKEAKRNLIFKRKTLGYCHTFWNEQKRILKDRYGIDWKTPADRNPDIRYD